MKGRFERLEERVENLERKLDRVIALLAGDDSDNVPVPTRPVYKVPIQQTNIEYGMIRNGNVDFHFSKAATIAGSLVESLIDLLSNGLSFGKVKLQAKQNVDFFVDFTASRPDRFRNFPVQEKMRENALKIIAQVYPKGYGFVTIGNDELYTLGYDVAFNFETTDFKTIGETPTTNENLKKMKSLMF